MINRLILFLLLGAIPLVAGAEDSTPDKVHLGIILPLTGPAASVGAAIKNGIELGLEKIPEITRKRLVLTYEDDSLQPKNSVSAFNKLVSTNKIDILINASSGTGKALAPLAERKKIPFLAIGASDPKISAGSNYVFNFWVTPDEEAKVALHESATRGYKKIARVTTLQEGMLALKDSFDKIRPHELEITLDEEFTPEIKDFRSYLAKVKSAKGVDALMVILGPGQCGLFAKQARELGITQPLLGFEFFEDRAEIIASNNALVGQSYINGEDASGTFNSLYAQRFPTASSFAAAHGHDAITLIAAGIERGLSATNIHSFLSTLEDFNGALGTYSATGDNRFTFPAVVKVVTEDGFVKKGAP